MNFSFSGSDYIDYLFPVSSFSLPSYILIAASLPNLLLASCSREL